MDEPVSEKKKVCFIITPIGNESDPIRRHIEGIIDAAIKPVFDKKFDVIAAHRLQSPGSINKQIIQLIYESDLVIVNLTTKNPNVMYELAFRHCTGKPTIMIAEDGTILPFDVSMERTIFYKNDAKGVIELKEELNKRLSNIDFQHYIPSNPILDNLRSIAVDRKIIKNVEGNSSDINTLKYILNRLDNMQNSIQQIALIQPERLTHNQRLQAECYLETVPESVQDHSRLIKNIDDTFKCFQMEFRQASFPKKNTVVIEFLTPDNMNHFLIVQNLKTMFRSLDLKVKDIHLMTVDNE